MSDHVVTSAAKEDVEDEDEEVSDFPLPAWMEGDSLAPPCQVRDEVWKFDCEKRPYCVTCPYVSTRFDAIPSDTCASATSLEHHEIYVICSVARQYI